MWKLIKWLILMAIVAAVILWFTDIKIRGRSLKERYNEFKQSELYREGIKDVRSIIGESLKALGEEISGEITDEERAELEKVIKEEMVPGTKPTEGQKQWQQEPLKALPARPAKPESPSAPSPAR